MEIRTVNPSDLNQVWTIFKEVIQSEDTFVYSSKTLEKDFAKYWFSDEIKTLVAISDEKILGTYILKPNQIDLGNHIANASYMVSPAAQGQGIGKKMCEHSLQLAKNMGFKAMQFNIVVSTNTAAVKLWEKFGFRIIGTTPNGFRHKTLGFVDTYIMYKGL